MNSFLPPVMTNVESSQSTKGEYEVTSSLASVVIVVTVLAATGGLVPPSCLRAFVRLENIWGTKIFLCPLFPALFTIDLAEKAFNGVTAFNLGTFLCFFSFLLIFVLFAFVNSCGAIVVSVF